MNKLFNSLSGEAKQFASDMSQAIVAANVRFQQTGDIDKYRKEIQSITVETNKFVKTLERPAKADLLQQLNTEQARNQLHQLNETTKTLLESTSQRAQNLGTIYRQMGVEAYQAFRRGEITATEFNGELKKIEGQAKADARSFGLLAQQGNVANVSMWKLGLTFDRLGARGPATVLRLVDTLKQINPAAIAGIAGVLAIGIAVTKLAELFVDLAKKATEAFVSITKDAVKAAGEFENLERQLTNIFKGKQDVARATLERILDVSTEFGIDLTEEIARVFLPLVSSFEQFEELGKIAATLIVGFDQSQETVARALTQAQARQYVTLQRTFKLNDRQVDDIEAAQNELGNTQGLIEGMNKFFENTGRQWNTYEDTIDRVLGTFDVFKKKFLLTFGEPIKNEVVNALLAIIDWINENKDEIEEFLSSVGVSISNVVKTAGDLFESFLTNIDPQKLDELQGKIGDAAYQAQLLVEEIGKITGDEFNPLIDGASKLTGIFEELTSWATLFVGALGEIKNAADFVSDIEDKLGPLADIQRFIGGYLFRKGVPFIGDVTELVDPFLGAKSVYELGTSGDVPTATLPPKPGGEEEPEFPEPSDDTLDAMDEYLEALKKIQEAQEELRISQERAFEDIFGKVIGKDLDARIAAVEKRIEAARKLREDLGATKVKILDIDFADLQSQMSLTLSEIDMFGMAVDGLLERTINSDRLSEAERKALEIQIDYYRDLEDAARDHYQTLEDLATKHDQDIRDQGTKNADKNYDIAQDYADGLIDIEIEKAKKIEEIEKKHRDRLLEIRKRYDFDAQEAARMNDAVALLRIRRRMELELELAQDKANEDKRDAEQEARDKREDLRRERDRELRDQQVANARRIRDIEQSYEDQIDAVIKAYEREINEINEQEYQKQQDLLFWMDEQLKDFRENWDRKLDDLERNYADELAIVKKWEARIANERNKYTRGSTRTTRGTVSSGTSRFDSGSRSTESTRQERSGPTESERQMETWRKEAIQLASDAGNISLATSLKRMTNAAQIRQILNYLRNQRGLPPRLHGGRVSAGMGVMTGEKGPEPFYPTQAGIIAPSVPLMMSSPLSQVPSIVNDNRRSIDAPISLLDPSTFSPIQLSIIRNIVTEEILSAEAV